MAVSYETVSFSSNGATTTLILQLGGVSGSGNAITAIYVNGGSANALSTNYGADNIYLAAAPHVDSSGLAYTIGTDTYKLYSSGANYFVAKDSASGGGQAQPITFTAGCYRRGTLIATDQGDVAIEDLAIGHRLITASGEARVVRWTGHRGIDATRAPDPTSVWPILVRADAFAEGQPRRDLWVSPEHKLVHGGVFIPAYLLLNGKTIVQIEQREVEYWHVELDSHDVILAEGLPTESYIDDGNRSYFVECESHVTLHPIFGSDALAHADAPESCLPLVLSGPELVRAKAALLDRVAALGWATTEEDDLHILADGCRIEPIRLGAWRAAFVAPAGCADISLRSRSFVPAHVSAELTDRRALGVYLNRLQIDGADADLEDDATCASGWHAYEPRTDGAGRRWTNGSAKLPAGARLVVIDFAGRGLYWTEAEDNVVALFG